MKRYKLVHKTIYEYPSLVMGYQSLLCLAPRNMPGQVCDDFELAIDPAPSEIVERKDYFGNTTHYFSLHTTHQELSVTAISLVHRDNESVGDAQALPDITCEEARKQLAQDRSLRMGLLEFMLPSPMVRWDDEIVAFAQDCFQDQLPLYECAKRFCQKIFSVFDFVPDFSTINTPIKEVLAAKKGVCQDFSHLAIACIRGMGFPVRYVSGYLETLPPPGKEKLQGSDASHAWISVFIPDFGWCDFDPTNNMVPGDRHIITAYGRDYSDVPPMKGIIFSSGKQKLKVEVDVIPLE
ncbi:transglutaminase-like putative cysteine protease [Dyadobacter jejuensis]|uniref:Transglutaminase-like putative cysteine protease n=1 Tax=Dyadobacter jejuensis TaxID=1082580 RepID=A0A316AS31_9BACT|nr:transglutaminase family protein [Dyadobacter jejuensis]PWJ60119.1 transglutaminase-like putative cysteine protease [Dyadobacter jejuensis]